MIAVRPLKPTRRKLTVDEYYDMADRGWFQDQRVELSDGEIIEMPAMHDVHVAAVTLTQEELRRVFGTGYWVRVQAPLHLSNPNLSQIWPSCRADSAITSEPVTPRAPC